MVQVDADRGRDARPSSAGGDSVPTRQVVSRQRAIIWATLALVGSTAWSADRRTETMDPPAIEHFQTVLRAGGLSGDVPGGVEARRARYDTVDAPLPAFRIPLSASGRAGRIDREVVPASGTSPAPTASSTMESAPLLPTRPRKRVGEEGVTPAYQRQADPTPSSIVRVSGGGRPSSEAGPSISLPPKNSPATADPIPVPPAPPVHRPLANQGPSLDLPLPVKAAVRGDAGGAPSPFAPSARSAEPQEIPSESDVHWPTVIYRSARVLIVVPEAERGVVEQVALKKIAGGTISKEQVAAVVDGQASFDSLSAGAYEVTYLARTGRPTPSTRRVLIELEPPPEPLSIRLDEPAVGPSVEPVPVDESLQAEVDATWDRLERGASYSSLHRFQQLVTGQSREASAEDATTDLVRVLSGQISLEAVEKSGRMTRRQVAEAWARQLGNRAELANAVYGMGRAYEMIEAEPRPLLAETGRLAEVCYQTAERLDPTLPGPLRDLGLRLLDRGLEEEGGLCLRQASQSAPDAETLMAMGQWHLRRNEVREATAAFEEAHRLDPTFVPALLERTKWSIVPSTGAVYPSELREVTHGLKQLATCPEVSPAERQWAAMQAARLRWMEQEMDANLASFSVRAGSRRTALSAENRTATAKITGAGEPARSIPIAVRATRTVSPAVADAISTQPRADIASVRPVVSNAGEGGRSTVVSSLSLEQPSTLGPAASASSMVSIPRAQPTGRTAAGANSQTPIRIPEAVPKSESSSRMGANR